MSDKPISPLRRRMIEDMTVRNFVEKTRNDYIRHVRTFTIAPLALAGIRNPTQEQTYRLQHSSNVVTLQAPNRLALEAGIGRSAARWYVSSSFEGGYDG